MLVDEATELAALVRGIAHGLIVIADNGLGDQGSEIVVRVPADALDGQGDVGNSHGVVAYSHVGADEVGLLLRQQVGVVLGAFAGEAGKVLLGQLDELLMRDATGADKHHAVGGVVVLNVIDQLGPGNVADVLAGTKDGAAQRLMLECRGVQVVKDNLVELLLDLLGLAQNHVALPLDGRLFELGVLKNIGQDIDALGDIRVECLGKVDGIFALDNDEQSSLRRARGRLTDV